LDEQFFDYDIFSKESYLVLTSVAFPCIMVEGPNAFTQIFHAQQQQQQQRSKLLLRNKISSFLTRNLLLQTNMEIAPCKKVPWKYNTLCTSVKVIMILYKSKSIAIAFF
jgi:hypothetical protein